MQCDDDNSDSYDNGKDGDLEKRLGFQDYFRFFIELFIKFAIYFNV